MSTLAEIEAAAEQLPPTEVKQLLQHLAQGLERTPESANPKPRVFGLHAGMWEVAPDFDAPLPDEFWLGKDA